jgi:hypothetical protein
MIEVEGPDGTVIEFPDQTAPDTIKQVMRKQYPAPMGTGEDMLRSGISGIGKGAAYLAGGIGDMRDFAINAGGALAGKLGASPELVEQGKSVAQAMSPFQMMPNSEQLMQGAGQAGIEFHKPQTTAGKYAETVGEFAPAAMAGPGGIGRKVAQAVIPGMASEFAGQQTEGTPFEPYARFMGAVAASPVAGFKEAAKSTGPTNAQLRMTAKRSFDLADQAGVALKPQAYDRIIDRVFMKAGNKGYFAANMPEIKNSFAELEKWRGSAPTLENLKGMREMLQSAWQPGKRQQNRILGKVISKFDEVIDNLRPNDLVSGDPMAFEYLKMGRAQWRKLRKAEDVEKLTRGAARDAKRKYTQAGEETALRHRFGRFVESDKKMRGFNPAERAAMERVVEGTPGGNLARHIGKYAPSSPAAAFLGGGVGGTVGGGLGFLIGGPPGAVIGSGLGSAAVAGTGTLAKALATRSTKRNASLVDEMVRRGSKSVVRKDDPAARRLIQAMLSSRPSI